MHVNAFSEKKPHRSYAMGCHTEQQAKQELEALKQRGVQNVTYERDEHGFYPMVSHSKRGLADAAAAKGLTDQN